jgi:Pilus formation protein N terminal region
VTPAARHASALLSLAGALLLLRPGPALAWPVDLSVDVEAGRERFHKLAAIEWVEVEDAGVASAELLPGSNELLLSGKRPGQTRVLLYAEGTFAVWQLRVRAAGERPVPPDLAAPLAGARGACPGLEVGQGSEPFLRARVRDAACREALLALVRTGAFHARDLELTFDVAALQGQLAQLAPALLAQGLTASYRGAGLVLSGTADAAAHRRALWALFHGSLGRVALEDRVHVEAPHVEAPGDAGAAHGAQRVLEPTIEVVPAPGPPPARKRRP